MPEEIYGVLSKLEFLVEISLALLLGIEVLESLGVSFLIVLHKDVIVSASFLLEETHKAGS